MTERLVAEIPAELKDLVDADRRTNKEVVKAALWREFGGERKSSLERRIEEKKHRISMIESERNERNRELEDERTELDALEQKLGAVEEQADEYEAVLRDIETLMHEDGGSVFPEHGRVRDAADAGNVDAEEVIDDLRERNPSLPDGQFTSGSSR